MSKKIDTKKKIKYDVTLKLYEYEAWVLTEVLSRFIDNKRNAVDLREEANDVYERLLLARGY